MPEGALELAKELIEDEFNHDERILVLDVVDATKTGNFEIRVDGELVHSKATRKDGFLHNNAKQQVIVLDAIQKRLDAIEANAKAAATNTPRTET